MISATSFKSCTETIRFNSNRRVAILFFPLLQFYTNVSSLPMSPQCFLSVETLCFVGDLFSTETALTLLCYCSWGWIPDAVWLSNTCAVCFSVKSSPASALWALSVPIISYPAPLRTRFLVFCDAARQRLAVWGACTSISGKTWAGSGYTSRRATTPTTAWGPAPTSGILKTNIRRYGTRLLTCNLVFCSLL